MICGSLWGSVPISWQLYYLLSFIQLWHSMYRHGHSDYLIRGEAAYLALCSEVLRVRWVGFHVQYCYVESVPLSVPQKRAAWHGREVVALDSALAPSYSPNMTTGKLHHLSEFLCPCLITIACKSLKLLYVKHLAHGLDKQTRDIVIQYVDLSLFPGRVNTIFSAILSFLMVSRRRSFLSCSIPS